MKKNKLSIFIAGNRLPLALIVILVGPALLLHLGMAPLTDDEGIRTLVAMEMQLSGNYITPTLFGEYYFNKPPLFNWMLAALFSVTGSQGEFTARGLTVFFLILFVFTIYYAHRRLLKTGQTLHYLLPALAFLTCGRVLFWDSMLALIDGCFSWVMYLMFLHVYCQGQRQRWGALFAGAASLGAAGFLLKGLPALLFLVLTVGTYLLWKRQWRPLLSWKFPVGMLGFLLPVGAYYLAYAQRNGLEQVFEVLFHESAKRTFVHYGISETVRHLFTFPLEVVYHFLPWTLLLFYFLRKNSFHLLREHPFVTWNALALLVNILPYWTSAEVYPRYLLMHVPLLFTILFYVHFRREDTADGRRASANLLLLSWLAVPVAFAPLVWPPMQGVPLAMAKMGAVALGLGVLAYLCWKRPRQRWLLFVAVMLVLRIAYNWFLLPERNRVICATEMREQTIDAAHLARDNDTYILEYSLGLQPATGYYFTRESGRMLRNHFENFDTSALYIINPDSYPPSTYDTLAMFRVRWKCEERVLGRINERFFHWANARKEAIQQ